MLLGEDSAQANLARPTPQHFSNEVFGHCSIVSLSCHWWGRLSYSATGYKYYSSHLSSRYCRKLPGAGVPLQVCRRFLIPWRTNAGQRTRRIRHDVTREGRFEMSSDETVSLSSLCRTHTSVAAKYASVRPARLLTLGILNRLDMLASPSVEPTWHFPGPVVSIINRERSRPGHGYFRTTHKCRRHEKMPSPRHGMREYLHFLSELSIFFAEPHGRESPLLRIRRGAPLTYLLQHPYILSDRPLLPFPAEGKFPSLFPIFQEPMLSTPSGYI